MAAGVPAEGPFNNLAQANADRIMQRFDFFTMELVRRVALACVQTDNIGLLVHCEQKLAEAAIMDYPDAELGDIRMELLN